MPRIAPLNLDEAPAESQSSLKQIEKGHGKIPNIFATLAHSPAALKMLRNIFGALEGGELAGKPHEAIALYVGERNGCAYCTAAHTAKAKQAGATEAETIQFRQGKADDPKTQTALDFAGQLMDKGRNVTNEDVQAARDGGLSDGEILEVVAILACNYYTNYVNGVADTDVDFPPAPPLS